MATPATPETVSLADAHSPTKDKKRNRTDGLPIRSGPGPEEKLFLTESLREPMVSGPAEAGGSYKKIG